MKSMNRTALIALLLGTTVQIATAGNAEARRMDRREARQGARIVEGVKSGDLTRGEAKALTKGQARVHRAERRAEADGVVSLGEKAKIERMQDKQSRKIHRLKHNGRVPASQ